MSEGTKGRGLSSMGLLRETPGGRKGLARESARREGGEQLPLTAGARRYTYTTEKKGSLGNVYCSKVLSHVQMALRTLESLTLVCRRLQPKTSHTLLRASLVDH